MGVIQAPKRINNDGIEDESANLAINRVADSLNTFIQEVYNTSDGNLTVKNNLDMDFSTITVKVNSSGVPLQKTQIKAKVSRSSGIICIRPLQGIPTSNPLFVFTESDGIITINNIIGLTVGVEYKLVLLIIGQ
jgi:hypothetical protein